MPDPFVYLAAGALTGVGRGARLTLDPPDDHHLRTVLRLTVGAGLELCDGAGVTAPARLAAEDVVVLDDPVVHAAPTTTIEVVHALPKGRKLDEVVRVLTELGVDRIVPVGSERSVVHLEGPRRGKAAARWRAVARAAGGQSRRPRLPAVEEPTELDAVVDLEDALVLVAHVGATTGLTTALRRHARDGTDRPARLERVVVAIGPEGGWSQAEVSALTDRGAVAVHLGPSVLRTEHAAATAVAVITAAVGRMD
jgi:16S rRNA (uracil1498-N3)-methyltransferase